MCLNHASEEELVWELNRRIDQGRVKFKFIYYYDNDTQQLQLNNAEDNSMMINFNQKMGIENAYFCRQVYKNHCEEKEKARKSKENQKEMDKLLEKFSQKK